MALPPLYTIGGLFAEAVVFVTGNRNSGELALPLSQPDVKLPQWDWAFTQDSKFDIDSHDYLITGGLESFSGFLSPPIVLEISRKSWEILSQIEGIQREISAEPTLEGIVRFFWS